MDKFTKQATRNFIKACRQVIALQPAIAGKRIKYDKDICELLNNIPSSNFSLMKKGKRAVTIEQLAMFCKIFSYDMHSLVFNGKYPVPELPKKMFDDIREIKASIKKLHK